MAQPGLIFEELHSELTAALAACRVRPDNRAVHSLRTTSRRMEALLLAVQEDHPRAISLQRSVKKALRRLKSLRGAAGPVRDIDVQRCLLGAVGETSEHAESEAERRRLKAECGQLDQSLLRRRKRLASKLASTVTDSEQALVQALEPVRDGVSELRETSFLKTTSVLAVRSSAQLKDGSRGSLHRYRKETKAARYLAEMETTSAPAKRLAKRLKGVLGEIGRWHDLMLLAREAKAALGRRSILTEAIKAERDRALELAARSVEKNRERL